MKNASAHDLSPGLLRQRRNLMVTSIVLFFFARAGAQFKTASALGVEVVLTNPQVVIEFIFIAHIYFLARYYQYFSQEPDTGIAHTFYESWRGYATTEIQKTKNRIFPGTEMYSGDYGFRGLRRVRKWYRVVECPARVDGPHEYADGCFLVDTRRYWFEAIRAGIFTALNRSYVFDYFLPFLLGIAGILVYLSELA